MEGDYESSSHIIDQLRSKFYQQKIQGVPCTYGILKKSQKTFGFLGNERLLLLKGIHSISYALIPAKQDKIPYTFFSQLPRPKASEALDHVEAISNDQEKLVIQFVEGSGSEKWEFVCANRVCAREWKEEIDEAVHNYREWKDSQFSRYEDYIRVKNSQKNLELQVPQLQINPLGGNALNNQSGFQPTLSAVAEQENPIPTTMYSMEPAVVVKEPQHLLNPQPQTSFSKLYPNPALQEPQPPPSAQPPGIADLNIPIIFPEASSVPPPEPPLPPVEQKPRAVLYRGSYLAQQEEIDIEKEILARSEVQPIEALLQNTKFERTPLEPLNASQSRPTVQSVRSSIKNLSRKWTDDWVGEVSDVEVVMQFGKYAEAVSVAIIDSLGLPKNDQPFPAIDQTKHSSTHQMDEVQVNVYFWSQENESTPSAQMTQALTRFRNADYLLSCTSNTQRVRVPLMATVHHKGMIAVASLITGKGGSNHELKELSEMDDFEEESRASRQLLLNENKCRVSHYSRRGNTVYFVDQIDQLLPVDPLINAQLGEEFIQNDEFEQTLFGAPNKAPTPQKINAQVRRVVDQLVNSLQNQDQYFTNSWQLEELLELYGLSEHHLGQIVNVVEQEWLQQLLKTEMAIRCMVGTYGIEMQKVVMDKETKAVDRQAMHRQKALSFVNKVLGDSEGSYRLWRNIKEVGQQIFNVKLWNTDFESTINRGYLLQAIQYHFKLALVDTIHNRPLFRTSEPLQPQDFISFKPTQRTLSLDYTEVFEQIQDFIEEKELQSFQGLCSILTQQISTMSLLEALKCQPVMYGRVSQYLLNFTAPTESSQLYRQIQESDSLPSRLLYESQMAKIRWMVQQDRFTELGVPTNYLIHHAGKWLGPRHPVQVKMHRLLAQNYLEGGMVVPALEHANTSLDLQQKMQSVNAPSQWADHFLLGKIHNQAKRHQKALNHLTKARKLHQKDLEEAQNRQVFCEMCLMLANSQLQANKLRDAYGSAKEAYHNLRKYKAEGNGLEQMLQSVNMIKLLLERNQEHESYYRFVEEDFSKAIADYVGENQLLVSAVRIVTIPYLKNIILHNRGGKLLGLIDQVGRITQDPRTSLSYIQGRISQGCFPDHYLSTLKHAQETVEVIESNKMVERWEAFNRMSQETLLARIGDTQMNEGFELLADLTALFNLLGTGVLGDLLIMDK